MLPINIEYLCLLCAQRGSSANDFLDLSNVSLGLISLGASDVISITSCFLVGWWWKRMEHAAQDNKKFEGQHGFPHEQLESQWQPEGARLGASV